MLPAAAAELFLEKVFLSPEQLVVMAVYFLVVVQFPYASQKEIDLMLAIG